MQVFRLHALPAIITPNALYFIGADGVGLCKAYVSGRNGNLNEIEGNLDETAVQAMIDASTMTAGAGVAIIGNEIRMAIGSLRVAG
jgi:hypothetical protein